MSPSVAYLTEHPECLNRDTLYGLREIVARYPYYQAARILFLQNLFILQEPEFGDELRRAALFVPDRSVLFEMVEGINYELKADTDDHATALPTNRADLTETLIDRFLDDRPDTEPAPARRRPQAADAATDYMSYLFQTEEEEEEKAPQTAAQGQSAHAGLIDGYISKKQERINLQDIPEYVPDVPDEDDDESLGEDYFTETLAKIYIKQGRYEKAMEIISKLNLNYPKKNRYFADQMRFLHKLVINQKHNKQQNNV